ncbi:MAG: type secretion system protein GspG [Chthoniobacteraceae bacterium]|nr:type secretion system protein GspG [Chthoniobacteraceae bacterium]
MNLSLNMKNVRRRARAGFTMIEIMLVVIIIVLLLGFAIGKMKGSVTVAKKVRAQADIASIGTQLMTYDAINGGLPSTQQGLKALVNRPDGEPKPRNWTRLMEDVSEDPFNAQHEYTYVRPGVHNPGSYDLYSVGEDGLPNTVDDIGNWK